MRTAQERELREWLKIWLPPVIAWIASAICFALLPMHTFYTVSCLLVILTAVLTSRKWYGLNKMSARVDKAAAELDAQIADSEG